MLSQVLAILWAQIRTMRNFYPRGKLSQLVVTIALSSIWYGMWTAGSVAVGILLAGITDATRLDILISRGLMIVLLYWQVIPVVMLSAGASLDLKRLLVYPISKGQLYSLDVLLSLNTGLEMLLVLAGASVGLIVNPIVPWWSPLGFLPFVLLNALLSPGMRSLLGRMLARKHIRETGFVLLVLAAAVPQVLVFSDITVSFREFANSSPGPWWPWSACTAAILGRLNWIHWGVLPFWIGGAYLFGRWQFEAGLRFDHRAALGARSSGAPRESLAGRLARLPSVLLPDPLGVLVEKEIRTLGRSPRFRLVFLMGFTFGLLIWLPIALHSNRVGGSLLSDHYLTLVSVYALLLLGEVTFWNSFGFDRAAAQVYFLGPLEPAKVLIGKNIAAAVFVALEVSAVAMVCLVLGMPVSVLRLAESYVVTAILATYMIGAGNWGATHYPRPIDPRQYWRSASAGRFQAMLFLLYPLIALPVVLAYLARYALGSDVLFYGILGFAAVLGGAIYWFALRSAAATLREQQEHLIRALSETEGPVSV